MTGSLSTLLLKFVEAGGRELVIISLSGGEFEIRGQVFALDAKNRQNRVALLHDAAE